MSTLVVLSVIDIVLLIAGLAGYLYIVGTQLTKVRDTLKAAAANTSKTGLIAETADGVEDVLAEGLQHHLFLGRVLGKVRY